MSVSVDVLQGVEEVDEALSNNVGGIAIQPELAAALAALAEATHIASPSIPPLPAEQLEQLEDDYQHGLSPIHEVREDWRLQP